MLQKKKILSLNYIVNVFGECMWTLFYLLTTDLINFGLITVHNINIRQKGAKQGRRDNLKVFKNNLLWN